MRTITIKCDRCGFEKTIDYARGGKLTGWASIVMHGPYEDAEVCPECIKSFIGVKDLQEEEEDD